MKWLNELKCPQSDPHLYNTDNFLSFFVNLEKGQRKVKVKAIGLVHNFIIHNPS